MPRFHWLTAVLLATASAASADSPPSPIALDERVSLVFATRAQAAGVLSADDDFTRSLSVFDRAVRMQRAKAPSAAEVRAFLGEQARDWSSEEAAKLRRAVSHLAPKLRPFARWLPKQVLLVKSTGAVEDGAAHTRAAAIVLPEPSLQLGDFNFENQLVHELFHVLTRAHPEMRDELYALIGFSPCPGFSIPTEMRDGAITNPDAPLPEHAIHAKSGEREILVVPVLQANPPVYDPDGRKGLFEHLKLRFVVAERSAAGCRAVLLGGRAQAFDLNALSGVLEQVGKNTPYVIHPEEILAENFTLVVSGETRMPTPEIPRKLRETLLR